MPAPRIREQPAISAVVLSYNARSRIDFPLSSLREQDLDEPYEVIVVDSGEDDCAGYVEENYPEVRVIRSRERLLPGGARNLGVEAARAPYVAFLADDSICRPDWLRRRLAKHRQGFAAVGGAITNGTRLHPVGTAGYYLEYTSLLPSERILSEQVVPHALSYERSLLERLGPFPEDTRTGEDTLFNERCIAAGVAIGLEPLAQAAHCNHKRLDHYLRHEYEHGRGLVQCVQAYGFRSPTGAAGEPAPIALYRIFVVYPVRRWWKALRRVARGRPRALAAYLALTPLVWAGLWAISAGAWSEWRARRPRHA